MLDAARLVAFVAATDLERARAFYEGVLGLRFVSLDSFACVLESAGTTLRIAKVDELTPQPFTVLGWSVADIQDAAKRLARAGAESKRFDGMDQDDLGVWTAPSGARVLWFTDPDGNLLSMTQ